MTPTALDIAITEENIDAIEDQMVDENQVASIDCMALNPHIAEQAGGGLSSAFYELTIHRVTVEEQDVFLLYFDDASMGDYEDFAAHAFFFETEAEAMAAMGAEYNDWLTRF